MHGCWNGSYSNGWMIAHGAFWIIFLAALLIATVFLLRSLRSNVKRKAGPSPLEILDQRYARGEIDREEYLQRKRDLVELPPARPENER